MDQKKTPYLDTFHVELVVGVPQESFSETPQTISQRKCDTSCEECLFSGTSFDGYFLIFPNLVQWNVRICRLLLRFAFVVYFCLKVSYRFLFYTSYQRKPIDFCFRARINLFLT